MVNVKRVAFYTLGCKLNFSETSTIARLFEKKEFKRVDFDDVADIYVINTCSVTENADKEFKSIVKKSLKNNSKAYVVAIGCYAQLKPEEILDIKGVDLILGTREKFRILEYIDDITKKDFGEIHSCEIDEVKEYNSSFSIGDRTRAFLKIQDGCDYKCTYCTIPKARGASRSDTLESIINTAKEITSKGIKEIILTGVNIGDYGKGEYGDKKHRNTFLDLLQELDKVDELQRIRISSIEPNLLNEEILNFILESKKFVPHFHIPLQSGNNEILASMKRRYKRELYKQKVDNIKKMFPDACIGADVITGYPGETDEYFLDTYNFINSLDISYLHVFSYSRRNDTEADKMGGQVTKEVKNKRSKMLRILSVKKKRAFYESQVGKIKEVIFESENKDGYMFGFTENYVRVKKNFDEDLINKKVKVKLVNIGEDGVFIDTELENNLLKK